MYVMFEIPVKRISGSCVHYTSAICIFIRNDSYILCIASILFDSALSLVIAILNCFGLAFSTVPTVLLLIICILSTGAFGVEKVLKYWPPWLFYANFFCNLKLHGFSLSVSKFDPLLNYINFSTDGHLPGNV